MNIPFFPSKIQNTTMKSTLEKTTVIKYMLEKARRNNEHLDEKLEKQILDSIQSRGKGPLSVDSIYRIANHANVYKVELPDKKVIYISYNNRTKRIVHLPSDIFEN